MNWLLWLLLPACLLLLVAVGLTAYGARKWADATRTLTGELESGRIDLKAQSPAPTRYGKMLDSRLQGFRASPRPDHT